MNTPQKRKDKVKAIQTQVAEGLHPLQHPDEKVRKKAALRVAEKMVGAHHDAPLQTHRDAPIK